MSKKLFTNVAVCLLLMTAVYGQSSEYEVLNHKMPNYTSFKKSLEAELKAEKKLLERSSWRQDVQEQFEYRKERLQNQIESGEFIFGTDLNRDFDAILEEIVKHNPGLKKYKLRLFISRSPIANAYCTGDGTIVFCMGLIQRLRSESQVAFVIAHELAHLKFDHVNKGIISHFKRIHSKDFKEKIETIANSEYNRKAKLSALVKDYSYENSRHSRTHESACDLKGIHLLENTRFNRNEGLSALEILDACDEPKYNTAIDFREYFSSPEEPFKEEWINEQKGIGALSFKKIDSWNEDSLKTHPDIPERIEALKQEQNLEVEKSFTSEKFNKHIWTADHESVQYLYDLGYYDLVILKCISYLATDSSDLFMQKRELQSYIELYHALKEHRIGEHLGVWQIHEDSRRDTLVQILERWRLKDFARTALRKAEMSLASNKDDEYLLYLASEAAFIARKEELSKTYSKEYRVKFPKGKYINYLRF